MKKQHYMTENERYLLEGFLRANKPVTWIAREMGFCRKTIYNEIHRAEYLHDCGWFDELRYSADKAQQIHKYNQTAKGRQLKIDSDRAYADYLEEKILKQHFSPAAALASARQAGFETRVCVSTLYSYIDKRIFLQLTNKDLWVKRKKKAPGEKPKSRVVHTKLPSIEIRPQHINDRSEPGHWEMDLVVGKENTTAALLTLTERVSRQELIFKIANKKAATVRKIFDDLEQKLPDFKTIFKSITTDNGPEFLEYDRLISSIHGGSRFQIYYCHSYAAWEKGTNENHNRMIRRWFPKGTDFTKITQDEILAVQNWMNQYPRKILGWKTPFEAAA